jgi:hypothetical protein
VLYAAIGDTPYNVMLIAHLLSTFVGFSPVFVHPLLSAQMGRVGTSGGAPLVRFIARNSTWIYGPAVVLAGVLGFGLAGMSDDVYNLTDPWLTAAVVVWLMQVATLFVVVVPGERAVGRGDEGAARIVGAGNGAIAVLLVVMLWLMIFKPGL